MAAPVGLDRGQVVDVAVALLEERGRVDAVTLRDVAERLDVRTQSLYAHLDGLPALRRALALRGLAALATELSSAAIGKAGGDAVRAIVRAYEQFAAEHAGLYEASLVAPGNDTELLAAMAAVTRPLNLVFESYGLEPDDGLHWYRIVFASVHGFAELRRKGMLTMPADVDESIEHMIDAFIHQIELEVTPRAGRRRAR